MNAEQMMIVVSFLLIALGQIVALLNYTGNMDKVLPGTILKIGNLRNKFPIDFNPPAFMFAWSFATHVQHITLGLIVIYKMAGSMKMFNNAFHLHTWSFALMSSLYVLFYGLERLCYTALATGLFAFNSVAMFLMALRRRVSPEKGVNPIPKSWEWWYDTFVINSFPPFIGWYVHSTCWIGTTSLSYVDIPGSVAQQRGWLDIPAAGSIFLCGMLCLVCVWIISDLMVCSQYTKYVWTMYPELVLVGFVVYFYNFSQGHGGNFNCLIYLVMGVISLVGWAFRGRCHGKKHSVKYD